MVDTQTPPPPVLPLHALQVTGSWPVVGVRTGGPAVAPPHLALPGAPTLFGGMPSGTPAMLPLHMPPMGDLVLGSCLAGEAQPLRDGGAGPSPSAVLMPMMWQQYLLSGGALGGAAFHRPGPQALVDNPLLFKPKATRATPATWGMIKSASMPELNSAAGGLGEEDFPMPSPLARHLHSLRAADSTSSGHHPMASIQEAGDL